jgi:integrase
VRTNHNAGKKEHGVATEAQRKPSRKRANAIDLKGFVPQYLDDRGNIAFVRSSALPSRGLSKESPVKTESPSKAESPIPVYNAAIQDSRMTFEFFVESKFIPEHVEHKTSAGRTHYQAILKHLLRPETVNRVFDPRKVANARLKSVPDWPYLDEVRLCDIEPDHVRRLVACAFAREYSSSTVKHIKTVLGAVISHAQREGCFSGPNPVDQVKLPPPTHKVVQNLTIDQTKAMLELMQYPEREVALITITTGMNLLEICKLKWRHVNLTDSGRSVDGEVIPPRSIAVREQWNRIGLADSKRGRKRDIEIPELLFSMLASRRDQKASVSPDEFVLVSETGQPLSPANVRMGRLTPVARKLGLPWLSWLVLRRAHTALLLEFRSQLNDYMTHVTREMRTIPAPLEQESSASTARNKSDTIVPKFSCRSYRAGRHWRERYSS